MPTIIDGYIMTLENLGYTVTPPPEKRKGKLWVYSLGPHSDRYVAYDNDRNGPDPVAIVDWEEGQGL